MIGPLAYLWHRLVFNVWDFFHGWYWEGSRFYWHKIYGMFRNMDRDLALGINIKHLTQPIYGDYSLTGHVLGPIFRLGRVIFGGMVYLFLAVMAGVLFLIYVFIPVGIIYKSIYDLIAK